MEKQLLEKECFVIMPITDPEGYEKGHFNKVYEDIFKVACTNAGFKAIRADDIKQTNLIHLDILKRLLESPMAICDLSSRNPNVLFELGLRQAFDKPTVLVQELGTESIFDISPLRHTTYRKNLRYREVIEDQNLISDSLIKTEEAMNNGDGVNSIVSLLSLSNPASLKSITDNDSTKMLQIVMSEMNDLRTDFRNTIRIVEERDLFRKGLFRREEQTYYELVKELESIKNIIDVVSADELHERYLNFKKLINSSLNQIENRNMRISYSNLLRDFDKIIENKIITNNNKGL